MKIDDPARPRLSGTDVPLINGSSTTIVPGIYIRHEHTNLWRVEVWLQSDFNSYSCKHKVSTAIEIASLLMRYLADPEKTLKEEFEWTLKETKPKPQLTLTLEDLEL